MIRRHFVEQIICGYLIYFRVNICDLNEGKYLIQINVRYMYCNFFHTLIYCYDDTDASSTS